MIGLNKVFNSRKQLKNLLKEVSVPKGDKLLLFSSKKEDTWLVFKNKDGDYYKLSKENGVWLKRNHTYYKNLDTGEIVLDDSIIK